MWAPATFGVALVMTILSAVFWGSWANTYKGTKNYSFDLFYWDYIIGVVLCALGFALTLGSNGSVGEPFLANVQAADGSNLVLAMIGGFIFNIANLLLVAGIAIAGLAVAFPIAIGIAVVEGVLLSYILQPKGNIGYLALGLSLAIAAILFDAMAVLESQPHRILRLRVALVGLLLDCIHRGLPDHRRRPRNQQ